MTALPTPPGVARGLLERALPPEIRDDVLMKGNGLLVPPIVAATLMVVGLLVVLGPARHSLGIHPTDALREQ